MATFNLLFKYESLGNETKVLGFDGAIYNLPISYSTETDFISDLVNQYGSDFPNHLQGMFAVCVWDAKQQKLLAVRDRMGECTLYYCHTPKGLVISTDIKGIINNHISKPQINVQHLLEPIRFTGPVDVENTWIEQIKRIQPGEYIEATTEGIKKNNYWKWHRSYDYKGSLQEAKTHTLELLKEAVDSTFRGNKKVAVMLSGGVDSSAVAALAKMTGHEVHSITTGYAGDFACDERNVARQFAKEQGFIHHEIVLTDQDYIKAFDELTEYVDEPMTDSTMLAQWCMFKKVKEMGFDVLLCGMGGDELFYGYPAWNSLGKSLSIRREHESIFPWKGINKKKHYCKFILNNLSHILHAGYPSKIEDRSYAWWIHDDYYSFIKDATLSIDDKKYSLSDYKVYKDFPPCELGKEIDLIYDNCIHTVMTGAYLFLSKKLGDGTGMEIRSPLLDYRLIEYVMSLPLEYKCVVSKPKQFLKDILTGIVPDYILYATKRGFSSPNSYIQKVSDIHKYQYIHTSKGFYNSAIADKMLCKVWKK